MISKLNKRFYNLKNYSLFEDLTNKNDSKINSLTRMYMNNILWRSFSHPKKSDDDEITEAVSGLDYEYDLPFFNLPKPFKRN